jgi:Rieske Fe-S protein
VDYRGGEEQLMSDCAHKAECSRRALLGSAAALACAPALLQLGCARRIDPAPDLSVPGSQDGNLSVSRASAPQLDRIGGAVVLRPTDGSDPVLLANGGDGFVALHARCPHAGCELTWVQEDKQAECPCHGSRFASDGTVLNPPARSNVQIFPVELDRNTLAIIVRTKAGDGTFPGVANGAVTFPITDHPELLSVGGAVTGKPDGLGRPLTVLRFSPTEVRAFDATCTHLECTVHHVSASRELKCPCHGSLFDENGHVLSGPAKLPLKTFAAAFDGTTVVVTVG